MSTLAEYQESARLQFQERLIRAGYRETGEGWLGAIQHRSGPTEITISLPDLFPFAPPRVVPVDPDWTSWSWHRERDGALCLIREDDHDDLWWADAEEFLPHVERWFEQADDGWPDDAPDLDLERYFPWSSDRRLVVYGELDTFAGRFVRISPHGRTLRLVGTGTRPNKARTKASARWGYVADIGRLEEPPTTWRAVAALLDPDSVRRVEARTVDTLVLRYKRDDHPAAIVLDVVPSSDGLELRTMLSAPDTAESRSVRAGAGFGLLQQKKVTILGAGALGSFVADALARAGVGSFELIDPDIMKPGNLVRHLLDVRSVGELKVVALRAHLLERFGLAGSDVVARPVSATSAEIIDTALRESDLVINATADFALTALLHSAAEAASTNALSTSLQNEGATLRVDVLPPLGGAPSLPPSGRPGPVVPTYEAGCGSPVSPTPPQSVLEAAAVAARHAVGLLVGEPLSPAGEIRELWELKQ